MTASATILLMRTVEYRKPCTRCCWPAVDISPEDGCTLLCEANSTVVTDGATTDRQTTCLLLHTPCELTISRTCVIFYQTRGYSLRQRHRACEPCLLSPLYPIDATLPEALSIHAICQLSTRTRWSSLRDRECQPMVSLPAYCVLFC